MNNSITMQSTSLESDTETLSFAKLIQSVYENVYDCARDELSLSMNSKGAYTAR